ncbi:MAG: OmpA family protein [Prevotellaceae bacterium]|jgi:peptidoglycan-associated lipoprotein|nr:OmpA family protein [Prevotellaceae bacterium]
MKIIKSIFIVLTAIALLSGCNSGKALLRKANKTFESGAYSKAIKQYRKALPKISRREQILANYNLGECFRILNQNVSAEQTYGRLVRRGDNIRDVLYKFTEVLVKNRKYAEAERTFETFVRQHPEDSRIENMRSTIAFARTHDTVPQKEYMVENFTIVNSLFNDFCPIFATNDYETIFFTSSRQSGKKDRKRHDVTGEYTSSIYQTELGKDGKWSKTMKVEDLSTKKDEEGVCSFNNSYTTLYFTKTQGRYDDLAGSSIYAAIRDNNYNWSEPEVVNIIADSINVGQPSISPDELTLYFVSDMPGGFGGHDIWKSTRTSKSDTWNQPINLGEKINTKSDEMFPYCHSENELYFSSTGHVGLGGLDIYRATQADDGSWTVENLGEPFNSNQDDFGIIFEGETDNGYFTSNRNGGKGGDDIYRFYVNVPVIEYYVEGIICDAKTKAPLAGEVKIIGNNGSTLIRKTEKDGTYRFKLTANTDYLCIASADKHLNQKSRLSTMGYEDSYVFTDTLNLTPTDKPIEIPNIFYEFGKADLNPSSKEALDFLVEIMRDNPAIIIELAAHTDSRGTDRVNDDLSQQRSQAVVDYMIHEGIKEDRMIATGYGKRQPKIIDKETAEKYPFLAAGRKLDDKYINTFKDDEEKFEICHQLNRRTELIVIGVNK